MTIENKLDNEAHTCSYTTLTDEVGNFDIKRCIICKKTFNAYHNNEDRMCFCSDKCCMFYFNAKEIKIKHTEYDWERIKEKYEYELDDRYRERRIFNAIFFLGVTFAITVIFCMLSSVILPWFKWGVFGPRMVHDVTQILPHIFK